ncbi:hypothetical protein AB0M28_15835 [Streptomyces sp. NPDC051940]|uniref:hypothetical protein n=1 Tax=Streptomyces sp. NPDC051940 TaxID=3155675 RepID=UPI00342FA31A
MTALPHWPAGALAVLATSADDGPYAEVVHGPVRAASDSVLLSVPRAGRTLARLRSGTRDAALALMAADAPWTVRGRARILADPMAADGEFAAVELTVTAVEGHPATDGGGLERRGAALGRLAVVRLRCRAAAGALPAEG